MVRPIAFLKVMITPVRGTAFWSLTFFANIWVLFSATLLWLLENETNSKLLSFWDALWWSFCTVSTVGYGDIVPITSWGRVLGVVTMLVGAAFFASFTALFAQAFLSSELTRLGGLEKRELDEIKRLEEEIQKLERQLKR